MPVKGRTKAEISIAGALLRAYPSTYKSWSQMRSRCLNEQHHAYDRYGGRGITISPRWESFAVFLEDMGERPSREYSLDRIDNDKGYDPSNCRWATKTEQVLNRKMFHSNKSGYRGVHWSKAGEKWSVQIMAGGSMFYLGLFSDLLEAAWMYDQWALELHGDLAMPNFEYV